MGRGTSCRKLIIVNKIRLTLTRNIIVMAFKYSKILRYSELDEDTLQLLEQIESYEYPISQPQYHNLGELRDTLTVEVTNKLGNDHIRIERISIADIKARIKELEKEKEAIDEQRKAIVNRMREIENPNLRNQLECQIKPFLGYDELEHLKKVLEDNSNQPDNYMVEIKWPIHRSGYYTRTGKDAKIVLEYNFGAEFISTYIHEMMHAFYDSARLGNTPNSIEYVEEPLAEYGMLRFLSAFVQGNQQHKNLLDQVIRMVNEKQYSFGLYHYAFGEYLFQNYPHIEWEKMLLSAKNKVDVNSPEYKSLQAIFQARPKKNNQDKTAQLLYDILTKANGMPSEKIAKQKRTKTTKRKKNTQQQSKQPLGIDEETYTRWLKRYQEEGVLPSEEEMDEAIGSSSTPSTVAKTTGPSKVIVEYHEPYDSFGSNYRVYLEYDYDTDELQYSINGLMGSTKKLTDSQIKTIKAYLKNRQNIEDFFKKAYDTKPAISHVHRPQHYLSMEYGDRSKSVANGELMPWAEPFAQLC